ncbi:MAG TPA: arylsulfatase [Membranihabitans sp.]|nr:arylsulfatase [Membranihabitans sp.]
MQPQLVNHGIRFSFILCLFMSFGYYPLVGQPENRPNVVIILADDMGYGDVSALNPDARTRTPHIDGLVNQGLSFTDAHASASVCTPSRYGILAGQYAWRREGTGVVNGFEGPVMDTARQTLGDVFKKAGYATACIGKWHLGLDWQTRDGLTAVQDPSSGLSNVNYSLPVRTGPADYGFDFSYIHPASLDMAPYLFLKDHLAVDSHMILTDKVYRPVKDSTVPAWDKKHTRPGDVYWSKGVWWRRGEIAESFRIINCLPVIAAESQGYIRSYKFVRGATQNDDVQPFFLYIPLTAPHTPWMVSENFKGKTPIGDYGDFVLQVDDIVGQVVATLKQVGEWDNTILIFSSDNGAYWPAEEIELQKHNSNAGRRGQKGDVWDGGHRIPLVISWPEQIKKPVQYDGLTSLTDFYATFKELLGQSAEANEGEDSESFLPLLTGRSLEDHRHSMIHQSSRGMFAIREGDWKYIEGLGSGGFTAPASQNPEPDGPAGQLYRLSTDPQESENLYLREKSMVQQMKQKLEDEIKRR